MKPIKLYFAGALTGGKAKPEEIEYGIKNKLCSYMYPSQFTSWLDISKDLPGSIILDSGAFSAWKSGMVIDIDQYIEYAQQAIADGEKAKKKVHVVNLDVIPGKVGQSTGLNKNFAKPENKEIIETAAMEGYKNLKRMVKKGVKPIHVFHQGESWKWLERMIEKTDYVGISPANDMSVTARKEWIRGVFEYLYKKNHKIDTHGFAVWMPTVLKDFPWTSCDAATWRLLAAWGGIYYPVGGFANPDFSQPPLLLKLSDHHIKRGMGEATPEKLKLIERDGYTYEDLQSWKERSKINIRYFLGLEKWLNEAKKKQTFKIQNRLL